MPRLYPRRRTTNPSLSTQQQALQSLAPHHRAMARLAAMGARPGDLAERFALSSAQVSKILASPLFQSEVARVSEGLEFEVVQAEKELVGLQPRALEVIAEGLFASTEGPNPAITKREQRRIAFEILDRTGFGKKSDIHVGDKVVNITYAVPEPGTDPVVALQQVEEIRAVVEEQKRLGAPSEEDEEWIQ